jgi:hypothetical protein
MELEVKWILLSIITLLAPVHLGLAQSTPAARVVMVNGIATLNPLSKNPQVLKQVDIIIQW